LLISHIDTGKKKGEKEGGRGGEAAIFPSSFFPLPSVGKRKEKKKKE